MRRKLVESFRHMKLRDEEFRPRTIAGSSISVDEVVDPEDGFHWAWSVWVDGDKHPLYIGSFVECYRLKQKLDARR